MSTRPPTGLFRRLLFLWRRFWCPHARTFEFYPQKAWWSRDGKTKNIMTHGPKVTGCMDCGETWAEDYAE